MNSRRSFLKGILATVAITATGKLVAAAEMLGNRRPKYISNPEYENATFEMDVYGSGDFSAEKYRGDFVWRNNPFQDLGEIDVSRYDFRNGQWIRLPSPGQELS